MSDKNRTPDDFWDLSSLLPKKRPPVMRQNKPDTEAVPIEIDAPASASEKANENLSIGSLASRFREVPRTENKPRAVERNVDIQINIPSAPVHRAAISKPSGYTSRDIPKRSDTQPRTPRPTAEPLLEYEPTSGLLRRVRVMRWPTNYSFYEQFRSDARRCHAIEGKVSPRVEFFSYTPQYRQMSQSQLDFYFYWRSLVRRGQYEPADFSYILLYVYEIINLHDMIEPETGLAALSELWLHYRDPHKALDKYLSEWVADFCLINQLPPPLDRLSPIMHVILETASFRELFMSKDALDPETLISLSSNYIWQKSKYASAENGDNFTLYKTHIPASLGYVIKESSDERFSVSGMTTCRVSRDAFCGSLCAHNIKRRIDIEYLSYSRSYELRLLVTDIVKYSENKLRAHLGIKSRLRVDSLDENIRSAIDDYYRTAFPNDKHRSTKAESLAAEERYYDAMYGALSVGIDADEARSIEAASWSVTDRLTASVPEAEAEDAADIAEPEITRDYEIKTDELPAVDAPTSTPSLTLAPSVTAPLSAVAVSFLRALRLGDKRAAEAIARDASRYVDDVAAEINDAAVDIIGDVILEDDRDGGYAVIPDYETETDELISSCQS